MVESLSPHEGIADFHTHTLHSDGDLTTRQLLERAISYGLTAISITDHDTVNAYLVDATVINDVQERGLLEVIPGIEISTSDETGAKFHLLGLDINPHDTRLSAFLEEVHASRLSYTRDVGTLFQQNRWSINLDRLLDFHGTITKAHIAKALIVEPENEELCLELTGTRHPNQGQLIEATMIRGKQFYIARKEEITPKFAIDLIHAIGGVAILAHPSFNILHGARFDELAERFKEMGVDGFEGIYIQFDRTKDDSVVENRKDFELYAAQKGLLITGGSDFHTDSPNSFGSTIDLGFKNHVWKVPANIANKIHERSKRYR